MINLTTEDTILLKCLIDIEILKTSKEFEYPCYLTNIIEMETDYQKLEDNELIMYHDGWNITDKGIKAYHENKHKLNHYPNLKIPLNERLLRSLSTHNKQESDTES